MFERSACFGAIAFFPASVTSGGSKYDSHMQDWLKREVVLKSAFQSRELELCYDNIELRKIIKRQDEEHKALQRELITKKKAWAKLLKAKLPLQELPVSPPPCAKLSNGCNTCNSYALHLHSNESHLKFLVPLNVVLCVILVAIRCTDDTNLMYTEFQSYASKTLEVQLT